MLRRFSTAVSRYLDWSLIPLLTYMLMAPGPAATQHTHSGHGEGSGELGWTMPPMGEMAMPMLPGLDVEVPSVSPFLPEGDANSLAEAVPRTVERLANGDTLHLVAEKVRRTINGRTFVMYGFNGQYPGPLIQVSQNSEIVVEFENRIDLPTMVHWHGLRLDNRFDGTLAVQDPVEPGGSFTYHVRFPDAGIYWYHPHMREDIQQDLGLFGNMLVHSTDPEYYSPVNREEVVMLDDLLLGDDGALFPYGREGATHTLMGRFGNLFLVNGETDWRLNVNRGEVVRFFLTNVSNTRTFNLTFGDDVQVKVVGADIGKFEREQWVESVVIAPAQRYTIEAKFDDPGEASIVNRVQAIDHFLGVFSPQSDTLGTVVVAPSAVAEDHSAAFDRLRRNDDVATEIGPFREHFTRPVDYELEFTVDVNGMASAVMQFMSMDTAFFPPVEWNASMPMMNWLSTDQEVRWILREPGTALENADIRWEFERGEVSRIRLRNDVKSRHPMSHPIHLHGQRFLVISRDGVPNPNLVWKDTVVVPFGSTVDILLEASNPGAWMLHCHIAEHLEAGMNMTFTVN